MPLAVLRPAPRTARWQSFVIFVVAALLAAFVPLARHPWRRLFNAALHAPLAVCSIAYVMPLCTLPPAHAAVRQYRLAAATSRRAAHRRRQLCKLLLMWHKGGAPVPSTSPAALLGGGMLLSRCHGCVCGLCVYYRCRRQQFTTCWGARALTNGVAGLTLSSASAVFLAAACPVT